MRLFMGSIIAYVLLLTFAIGAHAQNAETETKQAIFAAGCFWCIEKDFERHDGVIEAVSGYSGGTAANPTYKQVTAGGTGHYEVVRVTYDPSVLAYEDLLEIYWANVDPLDARGQFCDKGESYRSAIFYGNEEEKTLAEASAALIAARLEAPVATAINANAAFYEAEEYHQDYYKKNELRYKFYRWNCGRDQRLEELWGDQATRRLELFQ